MTSTHVSPNLATAGGSTQGDRPARADDGRAEGRTPQAGWWRRNALVLTCTGLFLFLLAAQSVTGWHVANEEAETHGQPTTSFATYLTSGHFFEATFENWESEFLQMGAFVLLTVFLVQKGSAESKSDRTDDEVRSHRDDPDAPWPVRRGGLWLKLYENSLFLAFLVLFLVSFLGHAVSGARAYSEEEQAHGGPEVTAVEFVETSDFWFQSFQNWQSEFLAVASISVLTIFLRQKGSSQSKPVYAPHRETGD